MPMQKGGQKWINSDTEGFFEAVLYLKSRGEARRFFRDLLTEKEILEFGKRWRAAQLLAKKVSYTTIVKETGLSSTTIARVHKWLRGGMGGYRIMLKRMGYNS